MNWPVIIGEEIMVMENNRCVGEVVGLFMKEFVNPASIDEVFKQLHSQGALAMVVHPFDIFRNSFKYLEKSVNKIDLLEVFNSRTTIDSHNKKAKEFALEHNLPQTANSDSHSLDEIGMSYTEVDADTLYEARKQLIRRNTKLFEKKSPISVHLTSILAKTKLIKDE